MTVRVRPCCFEDQWKTLSWLDRLRYRGRRKLGMYPLLIIHQGEYVIKGWSVPLAGTSDYREWGVLAERPSHLNQHRVGPTLD